jgi:hypothetical protein
MKAKTVLGLSPRQRGDNGVSEPGGVIVTYGEDTQPVSVEFLNASARKLIRPDEFSVTLQTKNVAMI